MRQLRKIILGATDGIGGEVKWNAPSFHMQEHFATMRLHGKVPMQLILHLGGKKGASTPKDAIADPADLLKWLGPDRACVEFPKSRTVASRSRALQAIVRQRVQYVSTRDAD